MTNHQTPTALELYPNYTGVVESWDGTIGALKLDNFDVPVVFRPDSFEEGSDMSQITKGVRVTFKILGDAGGRFISRQLSSRVDEARGVAFHLTAVHTLLG